MCNLVFFYVFGEKLFLKVMYFDDKINKINIYWKCIKIILYVIDYFILW